MEPGHIVYQGTARDGRPVLVRYPTLEDAALMTEYINTLSQEQTFISYQGETVSLDEETAFLQSLLKKVESHQAVLLLAFSENRLIGISDIEMKTRISSHVGTFGISLAQDFRGQGIGREFIKAILDEGVKHLPDLEIITLGVFANNDRAIALYKAFGFQESGRLPKGIKHRGEKVDHIEMYKVVREDN